jgi:hypothetical protein
MACNKACSPFSDSQDKAMLRAGLRRTLTSDYNSPRQIRDNATSQEGFSRLKLDTVSGIARQF